MMPNKCNAICWNYQEPINFTTGCDDSHCYTYDMRKMTAVKMIHKVKLILFKKKRR
jgi:DDB1- and CUL4-associated factor 13